MSIDQSLLDVIALSRSEYELIVQKLGREPNEVELGMFGALWSEHCGYKNSRPLLRLLPAEGSYVLTRRGAENARAGRIRDDRQRGTASAGLGQRAFRDFIREHDRRRVTRLVEIDSFERTIQSCTGQHRDRIGFLDRIFFREEPPDIQQGIDGKRHRDQNDDQQCAEKRASWRGTWGRQDVRVVLVPRPRRGPGL